MNRFRLLLICLPFLLLPLAGCARRMQLPIRPPAKPAPRAATAKDAVEAAQAYIRHLQAGDYSSAYALTSEESRRKRSIEAFERAARGGGTVYDVDGARLQFWEGNKASVALPHVEDPAWTELSVVKEKGQWKIVFLSGVPWSPQP